MNRAFQVGDHVWVGEPGPGKVHWILSTINSAGTHGTLVSGLSTRRMFNVALDSLTLHTPAQEGART